MHLEPDPAVCQLPRKAGYFLPKFNHLPLFDLVSLAMKGETGLLEQRGGISSRFQSLVMEAGILSEAIVNSQDHVRCGSRGDLSNVDCSVRLPADHHENCLHSHGRVG